MKFVYLYLLIVNAIAFLIMFIDKENSKDNLWRIPERTLLILVAIGGSLGMLASMFLLRHKTNHQRFTIGVPIMLAVHILILVFLMIIF